MIRYLFTSSCSSRLCFDAVRFSLCFDDFSFHLRSTPPAWWMNRAGKGGGGVEMKKKDKTKKNGQEDDRGGGGSRRILCRLLSLTLAGRESFSRETQVCHPFHIVTLITSLEFVSITFSEDFSSSSTENFFLHATPFSTTLITIP